MQFVLFNGPPRCGKDTAAHAIKTLLDGNPKLHPIWEKFSRPLKYAFAGMMNTPIDKYGNCEVYEPIKEQIIGCLGVSYRKWQQDFSEKFMKPLYGKTVFADLLLHRQHQVIDNPRFVCLVSDCGFQVEVDVLANRLPQHHILIVNIYRDGCNFSKDTREYVYPTGNVHQFHIGNNDAQQVFEKLVVENVGDWINGNAQPPKQS